MFLTFAWYCSRITWPGNSGSGMAEKRLMITNRVWSPASRSWSLWSVAAMNAMRTRSPRWRTRKSVESQVKAHTGLQIWQNHVKDATVWVLPVDSWSRLSWARAMSKWAGSAVSHWAMIRHMHSIAKRRVDQRRAVNEPPESGRALKAEESSSPDGSTSSSSWLASTRARQSKGKSA